MELEMESNFEQVKQPVHSVNNEKFSALRFARKGKRKLQRDWKMVNGKWNAEP